MTTIRMDSNAALSGAIRAQLPGKDIYLTMRDGDGAVLYSASVDSWITNGYETKVGLLPVSESIDRAVEMHAAVKRAELVHQAQERGLL